MKKLINDPNRVTREMLEGLVAINPTLALLNDDTVIVRSDKSKMWAYRYRPLYTSRDDHAPGDANGSDPSNLWHIARPAN